MSDRLDQLDQLLAALERDPSDALEASHDLGSLEPLVRRLLSGVEPRESLLSVRRLVQAGGPPSWPEESSALEAVVSVLTSGPEMGRLLARDPRRMEYLLAQDLGRPWSSDELAQQLDQRIAGLEAGEDDDHFAEALTAFRNDHYVRLAACEFGKASLEQVGLELANLADLCLDRAMVFATDQQERIHGPVEYGEVSGDTDEPSPTRGLAAVAMGKYGAQELNFCSDIDVVFIYRSDEGAAGSLSLNEFFSRVCQQVTRVLSEPNALGHCFRVDLRLRPEGSRGPICNALAGAERYYETWGGPLDRLAWLKARPAAGDLALGKKMVELLRPFVFPRSTRPEIAAEIQQLYRRLETSLPSRGAPDGWNVKLGNGGIRAVEFFVQVLQLLHAGKQPALQERATLRALDKLLFVGLIHEQEHRLLSEAYELFRRIEHRLQLHDGRQTHLLPGAGERREQVARHMGYAPQRFDEQLSQLRQQVREVFETLATPDTEETVYAPLLDADLPAERATRILEQAGFAQVEQALDRLHLLASKPWGPLSRNSTLALPLLAELARSPDPDAALNHMTDLILRYGPYQGLWTMLKDSRPTLRLLCSLFGSSDFLARMFINHPELLDQLLMAGHAQRYRGPKELHESLLDRLEGIDAENTEARLNLLRRFRNEEVLRIGLNDISGDLEQEQVWDQLTSLADIILQQVLPLVMTDASRRYGRPLHEDGSQASMTVLGLGKLGGRELTYASDLDLIFIYSADGATNHPTRSVDNSEYFSRVAQRLITALSASLEEGRLFEVDTRLRPSGNQGTLVSSWSAFANYHRGAQLWERQVLIKARPVAGDSDLGRRAQGWISDFVYRQPLDPAQLKEQIARHRGRIEKELAAENGAFYNLKLGRGGLLDVDFIVQYLQLRHGEKYRRLQVAATLHALAALERQGYLNPRDTSQLERGYRFLRRIESRLRIVRDRPAERLPAHVQGLEVMARRLGYRQQAGVSPGSKLLRDYQEHTEFIRGIYSRIIGEAGGNDHR